MLEKLKHPSDARQVSGEVPIYHRYTLGVAGERFFKELRDWRRILASPCPKCRDRLLPPKMYCERCFEETSEDWVPVEGPGYLRSFTVLHRSLEEEALDPPVVVALVGWPGVRGGLIHRVLGVDPNQVTLGMAVEPVWADTRLGAMSDISHFRPVAA
ncbi:MAG: Zn-ribbon domain-containing OB-fold protein [Chloroflexota bacterium]